MQKLILTLALCPFIAMAAPVDVNQADAETISQALTGIGPKKAEAIVQYRTEHGKFETLSDLEKVKGIGEKTLQANEKDILFGNEAAPKVPDSPADGAATEKAE